MSNDTISQVVPAAYQEQEIAEIAIRPTAKKQPLVTGLRKEFIELLIRLTIIRVAISSYRNPWHWLSVAFKLDKLRRKVIGQHQLYKLAYVDNRYYWALYTPGWNSIPFRRFIASEMNHLVPVHQKTNRFNTAYVALTKKCALQCEHCYEWDNLNKKETLSAGQLHDIVAKIQQRGIAQIHFSGGEPLLKIDLLADLLTNAQKETDFWVLTSGFKLTHEAAKKLKSAGLTGVMISLDHYDREIHNRFRGFADSYYWVQQAVRNAIDNNLVTALSVCATRDFTNRENLVKYAALAKDLGVAFIQILEPRAVGHYAGKDVSLTAAQIAELEQFYLEMNYDRKYKDFPLVSYHGYYQRRQGCYASGDRSFYIDTDGDINACPFCQGKSGNVLDDDFDSQISALEQKGCGQFPKKQ